MNSENDNTMDEHLKATRIRHTKLHVIRGGHDDDYSEAETICIIGKHKSRALQRFATIGWFTAFNGAAYVMTSCVASFLSSQLTTIEKQFGFTSRQTGLVLASSNIGYILCVLFVSHLGSRVHIPRALCLGTFLFGISGIICSLPHFLYGAQIDTDAHDIRETLQSKTESLSLHGELCGTDQKLNTICEKSSGEDSSHSTEVQQYVAFVSLGIILVGMVIQGLGKGPRFSFAVTYVDNNTEKVNTGFYTGIMISCSVLGPVVAFLAGGIFSQIYVTLEETALDPKHPKWIGAWWLGYLVLGLMTILVSVPLQFFPRRLPRYDKNGMLVSRKEQHRIKDDGGASLPLLESKHSAKTEQTTYWYKVLYRLKLGTLTEYLKDFLACQARLFKNPVFMLINACSACIVFCISSESFIAKYLEHAFDMPAHQANYTMAVRSVLATTIGTYLGGYLSRKYRMSAYEALKFNMIMLFLACLVTCAGFVLYCEQPQVQNIPGTTAACTGECGCTQHSYFPVCGSNGHTYYSPCQAGCKNVAVFEGQYTYSSCDCIPDGSASSGGCSYGCSTLYMYIVFSAITSFCQTLTIVPRTVVFIRSVGDRDKSASIGLQSFTNSLLGYLSGGLFFGSLIDEVCSVWDVTCGVTGHCLRYDNNHFRVRLHSYMLIPMVLSFMCAGLAFLWARLSGCLEQEQMKNSETHND